MAIFFFFFFFSDNAHSSELSNVVHGRCAWSAGSKRQIQVPQTDKNVLECEIKTGRISLNWRLSRRDAQQSRLEGFDGRGHNDSSRQMFPNLNSSREETVVEGIDTPSWNTELTTVSSRILSVWSQIQWCRYCDQSVDYSVSLHHHSCGLISTYFQCIPTAPSATCLCRLPQPPATNRPSMYSFFAQKWYGLLSFWAL